MNIRFSTPTFRRWLGWIITALALGFFVQRMVLNASRFPEVRWSSYFLLVSVSSVAFACAAIALSAIIWQVLLVDQGVRQSWRRIVPLYLFAQFGKYLPGNVGQFVGRVMLARRIGVPVPVTLATMLIEVLWGTGTALGLSALALSLYFGQGLAMLPSWVNVGALVVSFVALLAAPWVGISLAKRYVPGMVARVFGEHAIAAPRPMAAFKVSALYIGCFVAMGAVLQWQARGLFHAPEISLLQCSGFFALAWLAGYLLPGAPAGIGVRESMMVLLFAPLLGEGVAIALGVTSRLATTLADAVAFVTGWIWRGSIEGLPKDQENNG